VIESMCINVYTNTHIVHHVAVATYVRLSTIDLLIKIISFVKCLR